MADHQAPDAKDSRETQTASEVSVAQAGPAPLTTVWARIKEHKIAQWTLAYAAAAYALLDGAFAEQGKHLNGLDHLRAFAISYVFFFHYAVLFPHPQWLEEIGGFGWTGVDLFFVLSGYLIGGQLLRSLARKRSVAIADFYIKRFFRIIPAYWTVLGLYFLVPGFREANSIAPIWKFITFTQNLGLDRDKAESFSHAWSLCVEEHFYLVLPILLVGLAGWWRSSKALWVATLIVFGGMGLRAWSWQAASGGNWLEWVYYPTYNRLDGLLVGVCAAALQTFKARRWAWLTSHGYWLLSAGLALLYVAHLLTEEQDSLASSVGGFTLVSIAYGCVLVGAISPHCFMHRMRLRFTSTLATLSYSLYLTHKAAIHFTQGVLASHGLQVTSTSMFLGSVVMALAAAWILHVVVEKPFMALRTVVLDRRKEVPVPPLDGESSVHRVC